MISFGTHQQRGALTVSYRHRMRRWRRPAKWDEHWLRFGFGYWVVRRRDSARPIGFCGIKVMQLNESDVVNLFYRFDPAVWGNGLASEAASAVIGWAAQNIPGRALIARIRPQNVASQRVAIHAGLARAKHLDTLGEDGVDWIFVPTSGLKTGPARVKLVRVRPPELHGRVRVSQTTSPLPSSGATRLVQARRSRSHVTVPR
jgi:RimJ/RimL family protein N-acetyltransferase